MSEYTIFWEGRPYAITVMSAVSEACTKHFNEKIGVNVSQAINKYNNGKNSWMFKTEDILKEGKKIINKIIKGDFLEKNVKDIYEQTERLDKISEKIVKQDLISKSDDELIFLFKEVINTFKEFYGVAFVPILLECGENLLSNLSEEIIRKKLEKKEFFADYYIPLVSSPNPTIVTKEKLALLKMLEQIESTDLDEIKENKLFKEHMNKWAWISFDIFDRVGWGEKEYLERIKEIIAKGDIKKRIKEIEERPNRLIKKQKRIFSELKFNKEELKIIKATKKYGEVKEYRKNMILLSWYRIVLLLREIAKRVSYDSKKLQFLLPEEIEHVFEHYDKKIIEERIKESVVVTENGKSRVFIGKACKEILKNISKNDVNKYVQQLKGQPACAGKAKGEIKIINELKDASKMKEGDILVSTATFPELVPVMGKASAIITDEGGITCHAAIISRELDIPCVIGTKIATKILKDGDLVEVDASNGIVKRVQ